MWTFPPRCQLGDNYSLVHYQFNKFPRLDSTLPHELSLLSLSVGIVGVPILLLCTVVIRHRPCCLVNETSGVTNVDSKKVA